MLKNILLGIIGCILLLPGCSKDEDEDVHRTENITDWFEVKDKPGELNQLLYRIYKEHGLTIFVNDTLGQEMRGVVLMEIQLYIRNCLMPDIIFLGLMRMWTV